MMNILTPAERLIVAADFKPVPPDGRKWARAQVLALAESLKKTGVYIKLNSIIRAIGYDLADELHERGLKVFIDLKIYDIPETLSTDGVFLHEAKPELLTVVCSTGIKSMQTLKAELPNTEVLGVTILTSITEEECRSMYKTSINDAVKMLAQTAEATGMDGVIAAPNEATMLRSILKPSMTINTPGIRPAWGIVPGDDQNPDRIMTPAKAIKAGADRLVVGRPIARAKNPYDAVMRTIDEIASATA